MPPKNRHTGRRVHHTTLRLAPPPRAAEPCAQAGPLAEATGGQSSGPTSDTPHEAAPLTKRRADFPPVLAYTRGSRTAAFAIACDPSQVKAAKLNLEALMLTAAGAKAKQSGLALWDGITSHAGLQGDPLTPEVLATGVAILRTAGYRTAAAVGCEALDRAKLSGQRIGDDLRRTIQQLRRAAARGLGPPKRSAAFPVDRLTELPDDSTPMSVAGPMHPRRVLTIGCWWLTREIELGNASVSDVAETPSGAQLTLPVSKTDICAKGTVRQHGCACGVRSGGPQLVPQALCPACSLLAQAAFVRAAFPELGEEAPLAPTSSGDFPAKITIIATIRAAAEYLKLELKTPSGAEAWGGHALRRGGAQFLARKGVPIPLIQAMARHSSGAIFGYIENEHVDNVKYISSMASGCNAAPSTPSGVIGFGSSAMPATPSGAAATDERFAELARQIAALQAMIVSPVSPPCTTFSLARTHGPGLCAPEFVLSTRPRGKVHRKDPYLAGVTQCGWAWARCGQAMPSADKAGAPACSHCFTQSAPKTVGPHDTSSSGSESEASSSGSS